MFPKRRRIRDRKALARYHAAQPRCEVCGQKAMAEPHHLVPRSQQGDDVAENLLSLCWSHHIGPEGWHILGKHRWFKRFQFDLPRPVAERVARVAGLALAD